MEQIIPRWEWRTFGQDFGAALTRFAALAAEAVQNSEEIYLVATASDANVKIRDQLLDIKLLESVDADGLEQWRPVLKQPIPLDPPVVARARAALGLPVLPNNAQSVSLDRLLAEVASPDGLVHVVAVTKSRARYHVHGCAAELTDVVANGKRVRTIAIEDADPAKVIAAVRAMELDHYPNTNYPRGLKQILGLPERGAHR
jgi:exopolyphosphatase/guanosine-5'-triphosphate,3'-diphosphate pyrophosphatase